METRTHQRGSLFDLCVLKKDELAKGNTVSGIDLLILRLKAVMMEEDVDWVMARVAELP